jgi:hypothetical protein
MESVSESWNDFDHLRAQAFMRWLLVQTFKDTGMAIADPDGGDANAGVAFVVTDTTNATINLCFASISLTRMNN